MNENQPIRNGVGIGIPRELYETIEKMSKTIGATDHATTIVVALAALEMMNQTCPSSLDKVKVHVKTLDAIHAEIRKRKQPPPGQ